MRVLTWEVTGFSPSSCAFCSFSALRRSRSPLRIYFEGPRASSWIALRFVAISALRASMVVVEIGQELSIVPTALDSLRRTHSYDVRPLHASPFHPPHLFSR